MRKGLFTLVFLAFCPLLVSQQSLNNAAVVKLVKAGLSDELIVSTINAQPGTYDISTDGLIALKGAGVSDKVVSAIVVKAAGSAPPATSSSPPAPTAQDHPVQDLKPPQPTKPVEPELTNVVYLLDSTDHALKPLSKETAKVVTARKGLTGATGSIQIPGPASSFRVKEGKDLEFVVKCADPNSVELFVFKRKGDNREAVTATAKGKVFGGASTQREGGIAPDVSKFGESSYRFVVKAPEPGEYGFVVGWSVFHFAVDPR